MDCLPHTHRASSQQPDLDKRGVYCCVCEDHPGSRPDEKSVWGISFTETFLSMARIYIFNLSPFLQQQQAAPAPTPTFHVYEHNIYPLLLRLCNPEPKHARHPGNVESFVVCIVFISALSQLFYCSSLIKTCSTTSFNMLSYVHLQHERCSHKQLDK